MPLSAQEQRRSFNRDQIIETADINTFFKNPPFRCSARRICDGWIVLYKVEIVKVQQSVE